jgi:Family of unknown function (DUF5677)
MTGNGSLSHETQQRLAEKSLPAMTVVAKRLKTVAKVAFDPKIPHDPMNSADMMALAFTTKQYEHMDSVLMLIDGKAPRDACLVSRSMLEGLAQLQWAFHRVPERTDLWFWYGIIEDWRQLRRNGELGRVVDPKAKRRCDELVHEHGPRYYNTKAKERIEKAKADGTEPVLPNDPYRRAWNELDVRSMMDQIGGLPLYDSMYRHASSWIHWNPQSLLRAMNQVRENEVEGFTETDWVSAAFAMQAACRGLGQALVILDERFELGLADIFIRVQEQLTESMGLPQED